MFTVPLVLSLTPVVAEEAHVARRASVAAEEAHAMLTLQDRTVAGQSVGLTTVPPPPGDEFSFFGCFDTIAEYTGGIEDGKPGSGTEVSQPMWGYETETTTTDWDRFGLIQDSSEVEYEDSDNVDGKKGSLWMGPHWKVWYLEPNFDVNCLPPGLNSTASGLRTFYVETLGRTCSEFCAWRYPSDSYPGVCVSGVDDAHWQNDVFAEFYNSKYPVCTMMTASSERSEAETYGKSNPNRCEAKWNTQICQCEICESCTYGDTPTTEPQP